MSDGQAWAAEQIDTSSGQTHPVSPEPVPSIEQAPSSQGDPQRSEPPPPPPAMPDYHHVDYGLTFWQLASILAIALAIALVAAIAEGMSQPKPNTYQCGRKPRLPSRHEANHQKEFQVMNCINLKTRFGKHFKVRYEESYYAERSERAYTEDPWLMILPCQNGHIYPQGEQLLVASTKGRGSTACKLAALQNTLVLQEGSDGVNVQFHVDDFQQIAEIMKPRRRRRLTEAQRKRLYEAGSRGRELMKTGGVQPPNSTAETHAAASGVI